MNYPFIAFFLIIVGTISGEYCKFCIPSKNETTEVAEYDNCVALLMCQKTCAFKDHSVEIPHPNSMIIYCDNPTVSSRHPFTKKLENTDELCGPRCVDHIPAEEFQQKKSETKTLAAITAFLGRPNSILVLHVLIYLLVAGSICVVLLFKLLKWLDTNHEKEQLLTAEEHFQEAV